MAGFLYFLPDSPNASPDLNEWGLGHVGNRIVTRQVSTPMGSGLLVARNSQGGSLRFDSEKQTWRQIPDRLAKRPAWCGFWDDDRPTVADLAKARQLEGDELELLDGGRWLVPRLRKYVDSDEPRLQYAPCLPTTLDFNPDGRLMIGEVAPQYRQIWEAAMRVADELTFNQGTMSLEEVIEFAGPLLGLNYHVSIIELVLLGVIGVQEGQRIVRLALDMDGFEDRLKNLLSRPASDGTNSKSGEDAA